MTIGRDLLTKAETVTIAAIEAGVPNLVDARDLIAEFHVMMRRKAVERLTPWIERARVGLVASFASGIVRDEAAVLVRDPELVRAITNDILRTIREDGRIMVAVGCGDVTSTAARLKIVLAHQALDPLVVGDHALRWRSAA